MTQEEIEELKAAHKVVNSFFDLPLSKRVEIGNSMDSVLSLANAIIRKYQQPYRDRLSNMVKCAPIGCLTTYK